MRLLNKKLLITIYPVIQLTLLLIAAFLVAEFSGLFDGPVLMKILERTISPDGKMDDPNYHYVGLTVICCWAIIFCGLVRRFVLENHRIPKFKVEWVFVISIILIIFSYGFKPPHTANPISYQDLPSDFMVLINEEDGLLESATALLLMFAFIRFCLSLRAARQTAPRLWVVGGLASLALFSFVFCMEEISWGQRIFSWNTPEMFEAFNSQGETNFHNINQLYLPPLQMVFSLIFSVVLMVSISLKPFFRFTPYINFVPKENFFYLTGLIVVSAYFGGEIMEQILSIFLFAYSGHVLENFKNPPQLKSNHESNLL